VRAHDFVAVYARHHDVEQDEVRRTLPGEFERLRSVGRLRRRVALGLEHGDEQPAVSFLVVDDQDPRGFFHFVHDFFHISLLGVDLSCRRKASSSFR